jgi:nicotinamidase-related amidase
LRGSSAERGQVRHRGTRQGRVDHLQRRGAEFGAGRHPPGAHAGCWRTGAPPLGPDKFINSDLEKTLKDKGIKTVVAMGTQAQTSVLHTSATAALKGFKVIVPVDGMSADGVFPSSTPPGISPLRQGSAHKSR